MNDKLRPDNPILIVDDEDDTLNSFAFTLKFENINNLVLCNDPRQVMSLLKENIFSLILLDLSMPHLSGEKLLLEIRDNYPEIPVIIITGNNKIETAVDCMKTGAYDYLVKPVEKSRLLLGVTHALEMEELKKDFARLSNSVLKKDLDNPDAFSPIITKNEKMKDIFKYIEAIAPSPKPVLITGESGTGKELIAKAIHELSKRKGEFVTINIAGLDDNMFSDTIFGHKKGAFTGADGNRPGLIEKADSGTIFLDEIGDMSMQSQVKLLRLIQENQYYPLGSDISRTSNVRIIAATNIDLKTRQKENTFRKDLFYRIIYHRINIPELKERLDDLPYLIEHFINESAVILNKKKLRYPGELATLLMNYDFPGNIRELQSIIFDAVSNCRANSLSLDHFKRYMKENTEFQINHDQSDDSLFKGLFGGRFPKLKEMEYLLIDEAMKKTNGNQSLASELLGISQSTLSKRFSKKAEKQ